MVAGAAEAEPRAALGAGRNPPRHARQRWRPPGRTQAARCPRQGVPAAFHSPQHMVVPGASIPEPWSCPLKPPTMT